MQNAGLATLALDWRYVACDVHPTKLKSALDGARAMGWIGLNLTVPHKLLAMEWVDHLSPSARQWGAVNTLVFEVQDPTGTWIPVGQTDPEWNTADLPIRAHGHNTDADAILRVIREDLALEPRDARVLLLGAGGAGRTAALRLAEEGVSELYLVNRSVDKAEALAAEINERYLAVHATVGLPEEDVELVINATSLGLNPEDPLPLDLTQYPLSRADAVFDMIYRPADTPLLRAAQDCGCSTANGLGMLLYQGAAALELWTGKPAPIDVMRAALEREVYGR